MEKVKDLTLCVFSLLLEQTRNCSGFKACFCVTFFCFFSLFLASRFVRVNFWLTRMNDKGRNCFEYDFFFFAYWGAHPLGKQ